MKKTKIIAFAEIEVSYDDEKIIVSDIILPLLGKRLEIHNYQEYGTGDFLNDKLETDCSDNLRGMILDGNKR